MRNTLFITAYLVLIFLLSPFFGIAQKCGVLTFTVTELADIVTGTDCKGQFKAEATFNPAAPDYKCSCCEFRQRIKGRYLEDGNKVHYKIMRQTGMGPFQDYPPTGAALAPDTMSETVYYEDYPDYGSGPIRYGHRNEPNGANDEYTKGGSGADANNPDPGKGCSYKMSDAPGFNGSCQPGHKYEVDLWFEDKIITTCELCDGCRAIETHITASRTVPPAATPPPPPPPPPSGGGGGIGPDFTSMIVFLLLAAGWILFVVRKKYRTV